MQSSLGEDVICSVRTIIVAIIIKLSELLVLECKANSGSTMCRNRAGHKLLRTGSYSQFYKLFSYLNILMEGKGGCVAPEKKSSFQAAHELGVLQLTGLSVYLGHPLA